MGVEGIGVEGMGVEGMGVEGKGRSPGKQESSTAMPIYCSESTTISKKLPLPNQMPPHQSCQKLKFTKIIVKWQCQLFCFIFTSLMPSINEDAERGTQFENSTIYWVRFLFMLCKAKKAIPGIV